MPKPFCNRFLTATASFAGVTDKPPKQAEVICRHRLRAGAEVGAEEWRPIAALRFWTERLTGGRRAMRLRHLVVVEASLPKAPLGTGALGNLDALTPLAASTSRRESAGG